MSLHTRPLLVATGRSATRLCSSIDWFHGPHESAHELAVTAAPMASRRCSGPKGTRGLLDAIDSGRLNLDILESSGRQFTAVFVSSRAPQRSRPTAGRSCESRQASRHESRHRTQPSAACFRTRKLPQHRSLSAERLITQLEMTTFTDSSAKVCFRFPFQELDILDSGSALVLVREREHLIVMSRP